MTLNSRLNWRLMLDRLTVGCTVLDLVQSSILVQVLLDELLLLVGGQLFGLLLHALAEQPNLDRLAGVLLDRVQRRLGRLLFAVACLTGQANCGDFRMDHGQSLEERNGLEQDSKYQSKHSAKCANYLNVIVGQESSIQFRAAQLKRSIQVVGRLAIEVDNLAKNLLVRVHRVDTIDDEAVLRLLVVYVQVGHVGDRQSKIFVLRIQSRIDLNRASVQLRNVR